MRHVVLYFLLLFPLLPYAQSSYSIDTTSDPDKAVALLEQAIKKAPADPLLFCQMAEKKNQQGQYDSAIYYGNTCMGMLMSSRNNALLARALHAKGNAQYYLDDKLRAEENWRQALELSMELKDSERVIKLSSNLGAIYIDRAYMQNHSRVLYKTADSLLSIAYNELQRTRTTGTVQGLLSLRLIATSHHFQQRYDSADIYYQRVIRASKSNARVYTGALSFYAIALSERGKHTQAVELMQEIMQIMKDSSFTSKDITHYMSAYGKILNTMGAYEKAYHFMDSAYQLLAADYKKVNASAYADSEAKFRNQILLYQVQIEQQKKIRLYYIFGGIALLGALLLLVLRNRINKRLAQEEARQKQIAIDAFIEGEEKEKVRIGRELHDGIAQEIVGIKLAMLQQQVDPGLVDDLNRVTHDIRNISHELMPQTLKEYGLKIAVEDMCHKILAASGIMYEVHSSLPEGRMENKIEITLYRIFQELIHNIIKHSKATEVLVQLRKMNTHVLLMVEDNGVGLAEQKGKGIGISNLSSRVKLIDGNIEYDSTENEGTTAIVRVPV